MKIVEYSYQDSCGISEQVIEEYAQHLKPIVHKVRSAVEAGCSAGFAGES